MLPTVLYVQTELLDNRDFLRSFFAHYAKLQGKTLLVHGILSEDPARIEFTTKRLSANLSEYMVANAAFNGYQMNFLVQDAAGAIALNTQRLEKLYNHVDAVVVNTRVQLAQAPHNATALAVLQGIRHALPTTRLLLFANNPNSPLGSSLTMVADAATHAKLCEAYAEEKAVLDLALQLGPATLVNTANFFQ